MGDYSLYTDRKNPQVPKMYSGQARAQSHNLKFRSLTLRGPDLVSSLLDAWYDTQQGIEVQYGTAIDLV